MPRNKEQNQQLIDERKSRILHSALVLFSLYGYYGIKIDEIAKFANCSRTLVYHYFGSKEEIFHQLMKRVCEKIRSITISIDYTKNASAALHDLLDKLLSVIYNDNKSNYMASTIYLVLNLPLQRKYLPKPRAKYDKANCQLGEKNIYEIIYYLIEKGQKENTFIAGDPKEYTIAISSLIKSVAYNRIYMGKNIFQIRAQTLMNIFEKRSL